MSEKIWERRKGRVKHRMKAACEKSVAYTDGAPFTRCRSARREEPGDAALAPLEEKLKEGDASGSVPTHKPGTGGGKKSKKERKKKALEDDW